MGPEVAQAIVGVGKAVKAGNAIKGTTKNISRNIKKWNAPTTPKKSHFKKTVKPVPTAPKM